MQHAEDTELKEWSSLWRELLETWSRELVSCGQFSMLLPEEATKTNWLGFEGALEERIRALEDRLGVDGLPPSYHSFLRVTDGWRMTGPFIPGLRSTETVGWLVDIDAEAVRAWREGERAQDDGQSSVVADEEYFVYGEEQACTAIRSEYLETALLVSEKEESGTAMYLLNPRVVSSGHEWEAWFWASWLPGAHRYRSFWDLMVAEHQQFLTLCPPVT